MHYYYGITDYNALVMVTNLPRENCSFCQQGMASSNVDFKY